MAIQVAEHTRWSFASCLQFCTSGLECFSPRSIRHHRYAYIFQLFWYLNEIGDSGRINYNCLIQVNCIANLNLQWIYFESSVCMNNKKTEKPDWFKRTYTFFFEYKIQLYNHFSQKIGLTKKKNNGYFVLLDIRWKSLKSVQYRRRCKGFHLILHQRPATFSWK